MLIFHFSTFIYTSPFLILLIFISRWALAWEGDYEIHPVRACVRACVSVSRRFLQNCYSYRFFVN